MRILSRDFTPLEKGLLLALVGLAYYQFVDKPVREQKAEALEEQGLLENELTGVEAQVARLRRMEDELNHTDKSVDVMESYNNSKREISFLNNILGAADVRFSVAFSNVSRAGNQIRRNFRLQLEAPNFDATRQILYRLTHSQYRCILGNLSYNEAEGLVRVSAEGTFYETMVGGTPDIGLPADGTTGGA